MYACSVEARSIHEFTIICQQAEFQKYSSMYSTKRSLPFSKGMHPTLIFYGSKLKNPHKGHLFAANIQGGNDFWCNSSEWWDYWMGEGATVQPSIWGHSGFLVPWFDQKTMEWDAWILGWDGISRLKPSNNFSHFMNDTGQLDYISFQIRLHSLELLSNSPVSLCISI